jgi:hypothetical protein
MDRDEARTVLAAHLERWRQRSYSELVGLLGEVRVAEAVGPSGAEYQIEVEVRWDSPGERTDIRVSAAIDDGGLTGSLVPVSGGFVVVPDGTIR